MVRLKISTFFATIFICLFIQLIDMLSYGNTLFYTRNNEKLSKILKKEDIEYLKNCGSLCYIYSTIISQFLFNYTSKIPSAIISGVIVESLRSMSSNYSLIILKKTENMEEYISNFFALLLITTLTFAIFSLLLSRMNFGYLISLIPKSVIQGCLGTIGLVQFPVGWECLVPSEFSKKYLYLVIAGILIATLLFILQLYFPKSEFLIPIYIFIIFVISYSIFFFISRNSQKKLEHLRNLNLLPNQGSILPFFYIFKYFNIKKIKLYCIIHNIPNILNIVFFNLIYSTINLPSYSFSTNILLEYNKEIRAQGFVNIFTFIPSYFVSSYSITFHNIGGTSKIYGFTSAFSLILIAIFGLFIKGFIPTCILSIIPFLFFLTFLFYAFFDKKRTFREYFISFLVCIASFFTNQFFFGIFLGIVIDKTIDFFGNKFDKRKKENVEKTAMM